MVCHLTIYGGFAPTGPGTRGEGCLYGRVSRAATVLPRNRTRSARNRDIAPPRCCIVMALLTRLSLLPGTSALRVSVLPSPCRSLAVCKGTLRCRRHHLSLTYLTGRQKPGIKGSYEAQETVQEAPTRRLLRRDLPHQNPTGYPAAESRARRTPTHRTGSHPGSPGSGRAPRCISARSQPGLQKARLHASPGQGGRHGS